MREASEETALEFEVAVHEVVVHNPKLEQGSSILSWSAKDRVSKPLIFGGSCEVIEYITKVKGLWKVLLREQPHSLRELKQVGKRGCDMILNSKLNIC